MGVIALLLAGLKFSKVFITVGTMLLAFAAYAAVFGWRFGAGLIALLMVHELGHVLAARQRGIEIGALAFVPFMGAFISLRNLPRDAETDAFVAFGGPVIGSLAAFAAYFGAREYNSDLGLAVAYAGFTINLFNLLPVWPLDGGRIAAVMGPRIWLLGVPLLLAAFLYQPSPLFILIALFALPRAWTAWRHPELTDRAYYAVAANTRLEYMGLYLGLVALLGLMAWDVHGMLSDVRAGY